jgi:hypothetical protein
MFKNALLALAALIFIFSMGLVVGTVAHRWLPFGSGPSFSSATIVTQVQNLQQLVTVKYVLEKVVDYDDPRWYGDNRVLFVAHGVVKAGIDLAMLKKEDIHILGKEIKITLPPSRVTDVYLDDHHSEVVERTTGVLRTFDKDLEQNARIIAVDDLRRAALANGILNDATERAKVELTELMYHLGFTTVDIRAK